MDRSFQRIRSLMLRGTFYSVPPKLMLMMMKHEEKKKWKRYRLKNKFEE